jgi:hypothetical protein
MRAFTTFTPDFLPIAQEAGERLVRFGGISKIDYFPCKDAKECFKRRLESFLLYSEPVWHFDSDLWMLQECLLPTPSGNTVFAAPCDGLENRYMKTLVPPSSALDTCLVGLDMGHEPIRKLVERAIELQAGDYRDDTTAFNLAFHNEPWVLLARLSNTWNWCGPPKERTIAMHCALRPDKLEWLTKNSEAY